jgi:hypothetical protein
MLLGGPEGLKELVKGENAVKTIKFAADKKSAEVVYTADESPDEPTKFVKRDGKWLMVVEAS